MKDLMGVLLSNQVSTEYRVKFAFEPSKKQVEDLKLIFDKYDCQGMSKLDRTIFQSKPVDFYSLTISEKEEIIQMLKKRYEYNKSNNLPAHFVELTREVYDYPIHFMFINIMIRIGVRNYDYKIDDIDEFIDDGKFLPIYKI